MRKKVISKWDQQNNMNKISSNVRFFLLHLNGMKLQNEIITSKFLLKLSMLKRLSSIKKY